MKEVIIIVRPGKYFATKDALTQARFFAMSSKEVLGRGKARVFYQSGEGVDAPCPNTNYERAFVAKRMLKIFVPDEQVDELVQVVLDANGTGNHGDGKLFVLPVESALRIHTGETGNDALV